jgi:hypothetical protein
MNDTEVAAVADLLSEVDEFALHQDDDDDPIARYILILAQLRELLPLAQRIDTTVADLMPDEPPRRRRRYVDPVDRALLESLKRLPTDMADRIGAAIENVEHDLEQTREAMQEAMQRELAEVENRACILRQRLALTPGSVEEREV